MLILMIPRVTIGETGENQSSDEEKSIYAILESRIEEKHCPRYTPTQLALLQSLADDYDAPESAQTYAALMPVTSEVVDIPLPFPTSKRLARNRAPEPSTTPFLKFFPNPANDLVNLVFKSPDPDTRCRFILEENITRGYGILPLNASHMNNGTYLMRLSLNGEVVATEKFVIQK